MSRWAGGQGGQNGGGGWERRRRRRRPRWHRQAREWRLLKRPSKTAEGVQSGLAGGGEKATGQKGSGMSATRVNLTSAPRSMARRAGRRGRLVEAHGSLPSSPCAKRAPRKWRQQLPRPPLRQCDGPAWCSTWGQSRASRPAAADSRARLLVASLEYGWVSWVEQKQSGVG